MKNWCLELYDKVKEKLDVPSSRIKREWFILKSSRKWKIIEWILEWDNLVFSKSDFIEYNKYNIIEIDWVFELVYPLKTARDYFTNNKWSIINGEYIPIGYCVWMFRIYE